jgi:hypothetical protein
MHLTTDDFKTYVPIPPIVPKGEALRRAVAWLAEQGSWTPDLIDQASQRFDLSPLFTPKPSAVWTIDAKFCVN